MQAVCRRMLGDPDLDRRRLLVTFGRDAPLAEWLPADLTPDHETVTVRDRSGAVREVMSEVGPQTAPPRTGDGLRGVARSHLDAVEDDVTDLVADLGDPDPGRVRVAVLRPDHLFPDPRRQSLAVVEGFVDRLRATMRDCAGMALVMVPAGQDVHLVDRIREGADVQFEVHARPSFVEQRVVLAPGSAEEVRSGWHELP